MKTKKLGMLCFSCLIIVMLLAGLAGACGDGETTPTTTPAETTEPAAPADEPVNMIIALVGPPQVAASTAVTDWAAKVEEATDGRITSTIHYSSSLFIQDETLMAVESGAAHIVVPMLPGFPTVFELNSYITLPFLGFPSAAAAGEIYRELLTEFPELEAEFEGMKLLYPSCWSEENVWIHSTKKPVETMEDMKGLKVISGPTQQEMWLQNMGATPVRVGFEDTYMSLERGLVDAELGGINRTVGTGTIQLEEYHTKLGTPFDMGFEPVCMNLDLWNSFDDATKQIFEDLAPWYYETRIYYEAKDEPAAIAMAEEMGHTFLELTDEERQKWIDAALPIHEQWITDTEANGKPAQAVYDALNDLIASYAE